MHPRAAARARAYRLDRRRRRDEVLALIVVVRQLHGQKVEARVGALPALVEGHGRVTVSRALGAKACDARCGVVRRAARGVRAPAGSAAAAQISRGRHANRGQSTRGAERRCASKTTKKRRTTDHDDDDDVRALAPSPRLMRARACSVCETRAKRARPLWCKGGGRASSLAGNDEREPRSQRCLRPVPRSRSRRVAI